MVPVYGWALPEDTAPLRAAIERVVADLDCFDFICFPIARGRVLDHEG
jgi:hypothetical protein